MSSPTSEKLLSRVPLLIKIEWYREVETTMDATGYSNAPSAANL